MASFRNRISVRALRATFWLACLAIGSASMVGGAIAADAFRTADVARSKGSPATGRWQESATPQDAADTASVRTSPLALVLTVQGPIGPATTNYLDKGFEAAEERGAEIVVIQLDTPGGLLDSTRDIIGRILASPIPVATFVYPSGSRAASAGTYILYASHVAAMAPGTTMGAATPVQMGGSPMPGTEPQENGEEETEPQTPQAMEQKMIEDAVAYIRSLAELRDRNAEWPELAVREAATVTDTEALSDRVIDARATGIAPLLEEIDGRIVLVGEEEREVRLATSGAQVEHRDPEWIDELLAFITNPNVAFILMMVGVYGLFFELANPGAVVPGVLGSISLLMALYALNVLPINHAGLGLLLLGVALMVGEAFTPSFGVLGIGGLVAFGLGATMLFDIDDPALQLSPWTIGTVTAVTGLVLVFLIGYLIRAQIRPVATGDGSRLVGRTARVREWSDGKGWVLLDGEWWNAEGPESLEEGRSVRVTAVSGLRLRVEPGAGEGRGSAEEGAGETADDRSERDTVGDDSTDR